MTTHPPMTKEQQYNAMFEESDDDELDVDEGDDVESEDDSDSSDSLLSVPRKHQTENIDRAKSILVGHPRKKNEGQAKSTEKETTIWENLKLCERYFIDDKNKEHEENHESRFMEKITKNVLVVPVVPVNVIKFKSTKTEKEEVTAWENLSGLVGDSENNTEGMYLGMMAFFKPSNFDSMMLVFPEIWNDPIIINLGGLDMSWQAIYRKIGKPKMRKNMNPSQTKGQDNLTNWSKMVLKVKKLNYCKKDRKERFRHIYLSLGFRSSLLLFGYRLEDMIVDDPSDKVQQLLQLLGEYSTDVSIEAETSAPSVGSLLQDFHNDCQQVFASEIYQRMTIEQQRKGNKSRFKELTMVNDILENACTKDNDAILRGSDPYKLTKKLYELIRGSKIIECIEMKILTKEIEGVTFVEESGVGVFINVIESDSDWEREMKAGDELITVDGIHVSNKENATKFKKLIKQANTPFIVVLKRITDAPPPTTTNNRASTTISRAFRKHIAKRAFREFIAQRTDNKGTDNNINNTGNHNDNGDDDGCARNRNHGGSINSKDESSSNNNSGDENGNASFALDDDNTAIDGEDIYANDNDTSHFTDDDNKDKVHKQGDDENSVQAKSSSVTSIPESASATPPTPPSAPTPPTPPPSLLPEGESIDVDVGTEKINDVDKADTADALSDSGGGRHVAHNNNDGDGVGTADTIGTNGSGTPTKNKNDHCCSDGTIKNNNILSPSLSEISHEVSSPHDIVEIYYERSIISNSNINRHFAGRDCFNSNGKVNAPHDRANSLQDDTLGHDNIDIDANNVREKDRNDSNNGSNLGFRRAARGPSTTTSNDNRPLPPSLTPQGPHKPQTSKGGADNDESKETEVVLLTGNDDRNNSKKSRDSEHESTTTNTSLTSPSSSISSSSSHKNKGEVVGDGDGEGKALHDIGAPVETDTIVPTTATATGNNSQTNQNSGTPSNNGDTNHNNNSTNTADGVGDNAAENGVGGRDEKGGTGNEGGPPLGDGPPPGGPPPGGPPTGGQPPGSGGFSNAFFLKQLNDFFHQKDNETDEWKKKFTMIEGQLNDKETEIINGTTALETLQQTVVELQGRIAEGVETENTLQQTVVELQGRIAEGVETKNTLQQTVVELQARIAEGVETKNTLQQTVDGLQAKVEEEVKAKNDIWDEVDNQKEILVSAFDEEGKVVATLREEIRNLRQRHGTETAHLLQQHGTETAHLRQQHDAEIGEEQTRNDVLQRQNQKLRKELTLAKTQNPTRKPLRQSPRLSIANNRN